MINRMDGLTRRRWLAASGLSLAFRVLVRMPRTPPHARFCPCHCPLVPGPPPTSFRVYAESLARVLGRALGGREPRRRAATSARTGRQGTGIDGSIDPHGNRGFHAINRVCPQMPYDAQRDFAPLGFAVLTRHFWWSLPIRPEVP